jgi:uncharacterized protein (TIGR03382 family)
MKMFVSVGALLVLAGTACATPVPECFAFDTFDESMNLVSFSQNPLPGAFVSPGDGFQVYQRGVTPSIPFSLLDDTNTGFPADALGIVNSTKLDRWFGINDLNNGDNPTGQGTATWVFDITNYESLSVQIDMAAMGDFEATAGIFDFYNWSYSIDGGLAQALFTSTIREDLDLNYTMENGTVINLPDPMEMNGTLLSNVFQTLSANLVGTGNLLTLTLNAQGDSEEPYAFDNIVVCGTKIPAPGAAAVFGLAGLAGLRRRR